MKSHLLSLVTILVAGVSTAATGAAQVTTVKVDLNARSFGVSSLPFGEEFFLRGAVPENIDTVRVRYAPTGTHNFADAVPWVRKPTLAKQSEFELVVQPLRPDIEYTFQFELVGTKAKTTPPKRQELLLRDRSATGDSIRYVGTLTDVTADSEKETVRDTFSLFGETRSTLAQRFDADLGLLMSAEAGYIGLVSNAHFYPFTPLNKNADLKDLEWDVFANFRHRVSLFGGLALQELSASADVEPLFEVGTPVGGIGIRGIAYWPGVPTRLRPLLQPLRLNTGVIVFEQKDPNPLIDDKHRKTDWFVSFTADIELKNLLGPLAALF